MTVLAPIASGIDTRTTPPAAILGAAFTGPRVSVRRFGNEVTPTSNDTALTSTIMSMRVFV
jgi:hypothetical protein